MRTRDRCAVALAIMLASSLVPRLAQADGETASPPLRRIQIGAELGYAFPVGDLERGTEVSDLVHGLVPLGLEASYRWNRRVSVVAHAAYALGVPTLCATAGDCLSSLGHDFKLGVGARFVLPQLGPVLPQVRATFGYEWFRSELTDNGVTSGRNYRGPILASLQAFGNFGSDDHGIGPFAAMSMGIFSNRVLETPAFSSASSVDGARLHIWLELGVRGIISF